MMTALDAVKDLRNRTKRLTVKVPDTPAITFRAQELAARLGTAGAPPPRDQLNALKRRLWDACQYRRLDQVPARDWQQAAWIIWDGVPCLAENDAFVAGYTKALTDAAMPNGFRRLVYVYLRDFQPDNSNLERISKFLRQTLAAPGLRALDRWRDAHESFGIFDPAEGPGRVAEAIFEPHSLPDEVMAKTGLLGELGWQGFAHAVCDATLKTLYERLAQEQISADECRRILGSFLDGASLKFPDRRSHLANALLLPWADGSAPPEELRGLIQRFLLDLLKDPRVNRGNWQGVDARAIAVMRRWLAHETLEGFFRILDRSALDKHWKYRRAFWLAYHRRGLLDDAWLALGQHAQRYAREAFGKDAAYGKLGFGAQSDQSVLLLKVQGLIIVEWSHNGKCRVWQIDDSDAPALHRRNYDRVDLTTGSMMITRHYRRPGIPHMNSQDGHWQGILSSFIQRQTNFRIGRQEYMPDGSS